MLRVTHIKEVIQKELSKKYLDVAFDIIANPDFWRI